MGRLNDILKFTALNCNCLLLVWGGVLLGLCLYLKANYDVELVRDMLGARLFKLFMFGLSLIALPVIGCYGVCNQIDRGKIGGRRVLSFYNSSLTVLIVLQSLVAVWLYLTEGSLSLAETELPNTFAGVEVTYRETFNTHYFESTDCGISDAWLWDLVDDNCETSMSSARCECSGGAFDCPDAREDPDSPGGPSAGSLYDPSQCCPSSSLCSQANGTISLACPYDRCRPELLEYMADSLSPLGVGLYLTLATESLLLVLSCLLLCYNPRDSNTEMITKCIGHSDPNSANQESSKRLLEGGGGGGGSLSGFGEEGEGELVAVDLQLEEGGEGEGGGGGGGDIGWHTKRRSGSGRGSGRDRGRGSGQQVGYDAYDSDVYGDGGEVGVGVQRRPEEALLIPCMDLTPANTPPPPKGGWEGGEGEGGQEEGHRRRGRESGSGGGSGTRGKTSTSSGRDTPLSIALDLDGGDKKEEAGGGGQEGEEEKKDSKAAAVDWAATAYAAAAAALSPANNPPEDEEGLVFDAPSSPRQSPKSQPHPRRKLGKSQALSLSDSWDAVSPQQQQQEQQQQQQKEQKEQQKEQQEQSKKEG